MTLIERAIKLLGSLNRDGWVITRQGPLDDCVLPTGHFEIALAKAMDDGREASAQEINKARKIHELDRAAIDRWVPCAGHRDKTTRGICYVCENERLRRVIERLTDRITEAGGAGFSPDYGADLMAFTAARREVEDGRSFT